MNIGDRIGDYEIVAVLGAGGMGQVYKVRNTLSQRIEAMKVLLPNLETDPSLADRFLREIKVQAALDHPNIAKLHTAMRVGNQLVMFMEFVDGTTLAKMIEPGPLSVGEASAYVAQVLDALGFAHAKGVVHRDIKPANLMVTNAGAVKLMDFGIARIDDDAHISKVGTTVGSLAYMSPEQIRSGHVDARSDLYSLGITLYELVTGKRPFTGDSNYQIMSGHLKGIPAPPVSLVPGIPADLNEIILMAIAKEPQARFQSAAAFRAALVSVFPGIAPPLPVSTAKPAMEPTPPPAVSRDEAVTVTATAMQLPHAAPSPISEPKRSAPPIVHPSEPSVLPSPQTVTPSGRRGLYMAIGSIATVAVLIAAVIEGPKLMHGGSTGATTTTTPPKDLVSTPAPPEPAAPAAETIAPSAAPATSASDNATVTAKPAPGPMATSSTQVSSPESKSPESKSPASKSRGATAQPPVAQTNSQAVQTSQRSAPTPAITPAPTPAPAAQEPAPEAWHRITGTSAIPAQNAPPARPLPNPEAAELRNQFNELSIRANTARAGLQSFQQQQSRQGLGLRADIREAQTRLDFQLQESATALQSGNFDAARQSMRYAQSAVETIEKFLGR